MDLKRRRSTKNCERGLEWQVLRIEVRGAAQQESIDSPLQLPAHASGVFSLMIYPLRQMKVFRNDSLILCCVL